MFGRISVRRITRLPVAGALNRPVRGSDDNHALHEPDRWIEDALDFARIESHLPQVVQGADAGAKRIRAVPETGRTGYPLGRCAATSGRIASAPPWMARSTAEDAGVASRLISAVTRRAPSRWTSPAAG